MRKCQAILIDTLTAILILLAFTFTAIMAIYSMPPAYTSSQLDLIDTVYSTLSSLDKTGILNESIISKCFDFIPQNISLLLPPHISFNLRLYASSMNLLYEYAEYEAPTRESVSICYIVHVSNKTFYTTMLIEVQAWKE